MKHLLLGFSVLALAACAGPRAASPDALRGGIKKTPSSQGTTAAGAGSSGTAAGNANSGTATNTGAATNTATGTNTPKTTTGPVTQATAPKPLAASTQDASVQMSAQAMAAIIKQYSFVDPTKLIDRGLLYTTLYYFEQHKTLFTNQNYVAIIDYAKPSNQHRLFIINMHNGQVWGLPVAHGQGSDPIRSGIAKFFSDLLGSNASSLGFFRTADTYKGDHGLSLKLDGLSPSNTHARERNVVIHGADYVKDGLTVQGRSWGCPAVPMVDRDQVINYLKNGSLLYAGLGTPAQH